MKSSQPIPDKGMSYTWYEIEEPDSIIKMLTHIPNDNTIKIYPKPPVKKLFAPDRCERAQEGDFQDLWHEGEKIKSAQGQD